MNAAQHNEIRQFRLTAQLPRENVVTMRPGHRAAAARMGTPAIPGGHRPAESIRDRPGGPAHVEGLALAVQHDRDHRRVTAQHPQRLRRDRAAEVQTPGPGPVFEVVEPDQHVDVRAVPAGVGQYRGRGVVEHVAAHIGQRLRLPLPGAAVVVAGQGLGMGVDHRGDRVEHRRVVEASLHLPAAGGEPGQEQLVHPCRGPVVGLLTVLVQQLDQRRAPLVQLVRGVDVGLAGQLRLRTGPDLGAQPPGRPAAQHPGDHLDMPQPRPPRREHLRRRRQPGRQHRPVQPGPRCDLLGRRHPAAGLEPLPPQQVAQRLHRRLVAPLGERPVAVQIGDRGHRDLIELSHRRLAQRQHRHPLARRAPLRHPTQRTDCLR